MTNLKLTAEEIERYAPYHTMRKFQHGFDDYHLGIHQEFADVAGQAYDRGAECAMRRNRIEFRSAGATRKR